MLSNARIRQKPLMKPVPADLSPLEAYFQYFLPQTVLSSPVQLFLFPLHYWSLLSKKTKERMQVHLRFPNPITATPTPQKRTKALKNLKWIYLEQFLPDEFSSLALCPAAITTSTGRGANEDQYSYFSQAMSPRMPAKKVYWP